MKYYDIMNGIHHIERFDNPAAIFENYDYPMNEEQADYFNHVWDYESTCAYVINDDFVIVCDSITGQKINDLETLTEFYFSSMDYYDNEREDN